MRHLIGILLAVVMAGVLFFAGAWGYLRLTTLTTPLSRLPAGGGSLLSDHHMLAGLIAVAATGLLAGILIAAPRISPLAAGLPGLLLLGLTGLYLVNVRHAVHLIPLKSHLAGAGFEAMLVHGILGAAGLAMIVPMFVPSRWRARRQPRGARVRADRRRGVHPWLRRDHGTFAAGVSGQLPRTGCSGRSGWPSARRPAPDIAQRPPAPAADLIVFLGRPFAAVASPQPPLSRISPGRSRPSAPPPPPASSFSPEDSSAAYSKVVSMRH